MDPWEPSLLRGGRVCGDRTEWLLAIIDRGERICAAITVFIRKQREEISNKVNI